VSGARFEKGDRVVRLLSLLTHFQGSPGGLTTAELARRLGVSQRSIQRDVRALESELKVPFFQDGKRWRVIPEYWLKPIAFSVQEAFGLLLSLRLMVRYADKADAFTASAFEKLASVLPEPIRQPVMDSTYRLRMKVHNETYSRVLGLLIGAWMQQRQVQITYPLRGPQARTVWPLWLEPSAVGHSCYLLAWDPRARGPRVFKVERISAAIQLESTFEPPRSFSVAEHLAGAWGIWGSSEPVEIVLLFQGSVAERVQETVWHPTQVSDKLADGRLRLKVTVGSWMELRSWVLGWGEACEVVAPAQLRASIAASAAAMTLSYQSEAQPRGSMVAPDTTPIELARARRARRDGARRAG
jgi:predicted DNA-binding transcriptional regulator YafY